MSNPRGRYVPTVGGISAFVPEPLPRELDLPGPIVLSLDRATQAVSTLSGVGETLPNPYLLIRPFVRREAVLSSRIEGTQASISDLFELQAHPPKVPGGDVREVQNYVDALEQGVERLSSLPISVRFANELHRTLLSGVRGEETRPGRLRDRQVWIGSPGTPVEAAHYVPPPPSEVRDLLGDWEEFVNADPAFLPPLIECALMHYQFEAIHPYVDGNGRVGRLLIILQILARGLLGIPLLYLSAYFERTRSEYYQQLNRVSQTGEWDPWLAYFLTGVHEQAEDAISRSRRIRDLHAGYREALQADGASGNVLTLLDEVFVLGWIDTPRAMRLLHVSQPGARHMLQRLETAGVVKRRADRRPHMFVAQELLEMLEA